MRVLVTAEDLAVHINEVIHEAGWDRIPTGEILGDEAAWIRDVPDTPYSGVRQTLDYYQLSEYFYAFAHLVYPNNPAGAKA